MREVFLEEKTKILLFLYITLSNRGSSVSVVVMLRTGVLEESGSSVSVVVMLRNGVLDDIRIAAAVRNRISTLEPVSVRLHEYSAPYNIALCSSL
jgi:hypothetical protein